MFGQEIPEDFPEDLIPQNRESNLPWWIIIDNTGKI